MLSDLPTVKSILGITTTQFDAQITAMMPACDQAIKDFCHVQFEQNTYTEYYDGNNTRLLTLRQPYVTSVANVWDDDYGFYGQGAEQPFDTTSLLTVGIDYVLRLDNTTDGYGASGTLVRIDTIWPMLVRITLIGKLTADVGPALGNIKVQYTAGFAPGDIPYPLQMALAKFVSYELRNIRTGGQVIEERLGKWEQKIQATMVMHNGVQLPGEVAMYLRQYVDWVF